MLRILNVFYLVVFLFLLNNCSGNPKNIGLENNKFSPCPNSPNCVSSFDTDEIHSIMPIFYMNSSEKAKAKLKDILKSETRCEIVTETDNYIHSVFTSFLFRFKDDVEFFFPNDTNIIHVKSASRVGYGDLGVNRKRIDEISVKFKNYSK